MPEEEDDILTFGDQYYRRLEIIPDGFSDRVN